MKVRPIPPLDVEREFHCSEMFFSTTDSKGVILSGNDVFVRVSGFDRTELLGRPHNIIRHPDMPRAAFALLWANLNQGRPFAGYVKNMAKDGCYYWVFVVAVPASGGRYLSIRFKPGCPLLEQVEALYAKMLEAEQAALDRGGSEADAVAAGVAVAVAALKDLQFANYDLFSHTALNQEMKSRDARLKAEGARLFPSSLKGSPSRGSLADLYAVGVQTYDGVDELFRQIDRFVRFAAGLQAKASAVLESADLFKLHALNVNITAQRHGTNGNGVGVVASFLGYCSGELSAATGKLREHIAAIARGTETINARVAMARLQLEMLLSFQAEAAKQSDGLDTRDMQVLEECFGASITQALEALTQLRENLPRLVSSRNLLAQSAVAIEMAQVQGQTEAVRISEGEMLRLRFAEFQSRIGDTRGHLEELSDAIERIDDLTRDNPRYVDTIRAATRRMRSGIHALAAA